MAKYAVVSYDDRPNDDNEVEIMCMTDNFEYAEKLAFHYAKQGLPKETIYSRAECRILKNYNSEWNSVYLRNVIVEYRIGEVEYDDEGDEYHTGYVWNSVWAVVEIKNEITEVEDIDESLIHES